MTEPISHAIDTPQPRSQQVQGCCVELLGCLKGANLDEGLAVIEWLRMKITRVNAIIMDNPIDTSDFPRVGG